MLDIVLLNVGHPRGAVEGVLTFAGLGLSGVGVAVAVLAFQRAFRRARDNEG